jgi:hypothetical protein
MSRNFSPDPIRITTRVVDEEYLVIDVNYSQVQPDIEDLTLNMEGNEDNVSKTSELAYLGKLEYSIDYDFQKQEV